MLDDKKFDPCISNRVENFVLMGNKIQHHGYDSNKLIMQNSSGFETVILGRY